MTTHKFPIGSKIVRINPVEYDRYQCSFIIKAHSYGGNSEQYEFEPQKNCGTNSSIEWIETNYKLEKPLFKFPIGSMISWNNMPTKEYYLVTGYDYKYDQYNLEVIKTTSDFGLSVGYKFPYSRESTEKVHTLISNEITNTDFKFKIGDKIKNYSEYVVADYYKDTHYIMQTDDCSVFMYKKDLVESSYRLSNICIPANPLESGWHWIHNDHNKIPVNTLFPKYWDANLQKWRRGTKNAEIDPIKMYLSGNRYDKPCNY